MTKGIKGTRVPDLDATYVRGLRNALKCRHLARINRQIARALVIQLRRLRASRKGDQ